MMLSRSPASSRRRSGGPAALGRGGSTSQILRRSSIALPAGRRGGRPVEQLVQHRADRVHIGRSGYHVAARLLRARVLGSEHRRAGPGPSLALEAGDRREELGDAEVEDLRRTDGVDKDVAGLDVAMDHEVLVCVLERGAHPTNEGDPRAHGELVVRDVPGDRGALDVLHRQVGQAVVGATTVEQAHDVGVFERREDLPLVAEPCNRLGRPHGMRQDLDRDSMMELRIIALREVHRAHAALSEEREQPERADPASDVGGGGVAREHLGLGDDRVAQRRPRVTRAGE